MGFWKGAVGTPKQKLFWVVFSIIVAIVALAVMFLLMPIRVSRIVALYRGEWAHFYPDSFWHDHATYKFTSSPKDESSTPVVIDGGVAHVYNMNRNGVYLGFDNNAEGIGRMVIGNSTMSNVYPNWNRTITVTDGSTIGVTLDREASNPIDFIVTKDIFVLENWAKGREDLIDEDDYFEWIKGTKQLSSTVEVSSDTKYLATQRIGVGIKVSDPKNIVGIEGKLFISVAKINLLNSTNFTSNVAELEFNQRQLLQIDAPEACTSNTSLYCKLEVAIEPRWSLYFGLVVIPICLASVLFVVGLMAIKAFHVRQMIAMMRKKATEEGVALEEGKSKDIHQERLDEANAEGDMSEPHNSSDEPLGDEDDGKKSSPRDSQPDGSAVLSAAPDGDN